jgi:S-adenosylmethionine uptake transporter
MQALWMVVASLLFAAMGVCIKNAYAYFNTAELIAYRGGLSAVVLLGIMRWQGTPLKTTVPMMHLWRSVVGVASLASWFYAIGGLPLSTAMTLNYMSSVWVATFLVGGALLLMTRGDSLTQAKASAGLNGWLIATIVLGFVGVGFILKPSIEQNQLWPGFVGLLSGVGAALAYLQVAALGRIGEPDSRVVLYFSLCAAICGIVAAQFSGWNELTWAGVKWLVPMALLAVGGQLLMTRAYSRGATLVVANLQYTGVVFGALFGVWVFEEKLDADAWIGMTMIIASGIGATILREKTSPNLHQEDRP